MVPLFVAIGVILVVAGGTTVVLQWERISTFFNGKTLVVLGARETGKTTLVQFLKEGSIAESYDATTHRVVTSGKRLKLSELTLTVEEFIDHPGGEDFLPWWKQAYDKSDIVVYLVRWDILKANDQDYKIRVERDFRHIGKWRESKPVLFVLMGTFADKDARYQEKGTKAAELQDDFRKHVSRFGINTGKQTFCVLGSLKTKEDAERLLWSLLQEGLTDAEA